MLSDQQALRLIEATRANTESAAIRELLDWILARLAERDVAVALAAKPKRSRKEYLRIYMRDYRAGKRRT